LAILAVAPGTETLEYAGPLSSRATALSLRGDHARARRDSARAIAIVTKLQGPTSVTTLELRPYHARILAKANDRPAALRELEAILEPMKATRNEALIAAVELELAKLYAAGDAARARELARSAKDRYTRLGTVGKRGASEAA